MWPALVPIALLLIAFTVYCLVDLRRSQVQHLPKWAWALVILFVSSRIGGILYLAVEKVQR